METPKNCNECPMRYVCETYYGSTTCAYRDDIDSK